MLKTIQIHDIVKIAFEAGQKILPIYKTDHLKVDVKSDDSPVTLADKTAHYYIYEQLSTRYPDIPVISEEGDIADFTVRKEWRYAWLVDPLDGTKEFIKKNGEFTINIGLLQEGVPVLGVIYIPAQDIMYFASSDIGSYKLANCAQALAEQDVTGAAQKLPLPKQHEGIRVVVSRSHSSAETEDYLNELAQQHTIIETIASGSSIKMCLIAEGVADIYPRLSYSMEWDTAAGEAIARYSGAHVEVYPTKFPMQYNKENLKNPFHIVYRD
ncbi:MAG: 3'(2'),5'-bisphosphate nucleotidase CysQ [Solibacillus sp.]